MVSHWKEKIQQKRLERGFSGEYLDLKDRGTARSWKKEASKYSIFVKHYSIQENITNKSRSTQGRHRRKH
jgi:hypothetical protein